jgi:AcrR family transcriptional regulator
MSAPSRKPGKARATRTSPVRKRLMAAAERLFAERGWEAVSVRSIVAAAGVNLAALNYHFGSKQQLLREIFVTRAKPIVQERMRHIEEIRQRGGTPCLEEILEGFLRPALGIDAQRMGGRFVKLRARLGAAPDAISRKILSDTFDESSRAFLTEIKRALPEIPSADLEWRFHFLFGTMVYTMANVGRIESLTGARCDTSDVELALQHLIPFLAAGFRSAPVGITRQQERPRQGRSKQARRHRTDPAGRATLVGRTEDAHS